MAKIAIPRLVDVVPRPSDLQTITDRLTEVGLLGSPLSNVRITVQDDAGSIAAAVIMHIADDNGVPYWAGCTLALAKDASPEVTTRVNRLLNGFAIKRQGLALGFAKTPRFEKNWRTNKVSASHRGHRIATPLVAEAKAHVTSTAISTLWSVRQSPVSLDSNLAAGYAPLPAPTVRRTVRRSRRSSSTPVTPKVASVTPSVTPSGSPKPQTAHIPLAKPAVKLPANHPGIFRELGKKPYTVHTEPEVARKLAAAWSKFQTDPDIVVIALRGPSGAGKTLTAIDLAATNGLPFAKFEVPAMRDFSDWFGSVSLRETDTGKVVTEFTPSDFCEAIRLDGPYSGIPRLVLLDEFTRAETSMAMNALLAVTDGSGSVYIPDARKSIEVDPAVLWVVTANIGSAYSGTGTLDRALANRVTDWINVEFPALAVEVKIVAEQAAITEQVALPLVRVATSLRGMANRGEIPEGVSTRQLVRIGKAVKHGLSPVEAYEVGFADNAAFSREGGSDSDYERIMVQVNQSLR